jgi:hypothetical protein
MSFIDDVFSQLKNSTWLLAFGFKFAIKILVDQNDR